MAANITGLWGSLMSWPVIGIHSIITQDGKVLSFGTDQSGAQGAVMYHDLWDPVTNTHTLIDHHMSTPTDIFCANAIIVPGTTKIMIAGGDARPFGQINYGVADVNIFDSTTGMITPESHGKMAFARWYATSISLTTGQLLVLGGRDFAGNTIKVPEVFTPGLGWKTLTGAQDSEASAFYDRAFMNTQGKAVYFTYSGKVMQVETTGTGALTKIGALPFAINWESPAIEYAAGKILVNDEGRGLWSVDINGPEATYTHVADLATERNWANMTVLADGKVMISGGSTVTRSDSTAVKAALIWDPVSNTLTTMAEEDVPRLYHSTAVLLPDGSVLSMGGGGVKTVSADFINRLDGQVYRPTYLFDAAGADAVRPVVVETPQHVQSGSSFTITMDNAADIVRLTFVKTGSATHSFNMNAGFVELAFTLGPDNTINVELPDYHEGVTAGSWMLFAWNSAGTPSVAPIIAVDPVYATGAEVDSLNLLTNGSFETAAGFAAARNLDEVIGWHSTKDNFQLWKNGNSGIAANDGATALEIDAGRGTVWQEVHTRAGQAYELSFDFAGRAGFIGSSRMEVLWNGSVVATIAPSNAAFKNYVLNVTGTGGNDQLAFRALSSDQDVAGGYLDHVKFKLAGALPPDDMLKNGDFEQPVLADWANWQGFSNAQMPGWLNMGASSIALVKYAGSQRLDLDSTGSVDEVYQLLQTSAAETYTLSFDAVATKGKSSTFDVFWNGVKVTTITPNELATETYTLSVAGTGGLDRLSFREIDTQNDYLGAYIDNVTIVAAQPSVAAPAATSALVTHAGNHVMGTDASETLWGTSAMDHIMAMGGNDIVVAFGGDDTIDGGTGTDTLRIAARPAELRLTRNSDGTYEIATRSQTFEVTGIERIALKAGSKAFGTYGIQTLVKALSTPVDSAHNKANLLANGSFETIGKMVSEGASRLHVNDAALTGWTSAKSGFEIWHDGYRNQPGTHQHNAVEVDAYDGTISQSLKTQADHIYRLQFDYAGQNGHVQSSAMQVVWNGRVIMTLHPDDADFSHFAVSMTGTGGTDTLSFRSLGGDTDSHGGLLDNVSLRDFTLLIA